MKILTMLSLKIDPDKNMHSWTTGNDCKQTAAKVANVNSVMGKSTSLTTIFAVSDH